jgi:glycosyltransferase involved in cell wall biosynthesis
MPRPDVSVAETPPILWFTTTGGDHIEARNAEYLLAPLEPTMYYFDRRRKIRSAVRLVRLGWITRPRLIVFDGAGVAGGISVLFLDLFARIPYVMWNGDAIGPIRAMLAGRVGRRSRLVAALGYVYELVLCRRCAGYIGRSPYLVGRGLTFGAPRAVTAEGWSRARPSPGARETIRAELGIDNDAIVVGVVGTLDWTESTQYVYGLELVRAISRLIRRDVVACIFGEGTGRGRLEVLAAKELGHRVLLPGRIPHARVADYLAALDVASLSQSVDDVGSIRYTTKISEYFAAGLPLIATQVPVAYDLDFGQIWRLPGYAPWSTVYIEALVDLLERLSVSEIRHRAEALRLCNAKLFDPTMQRARVEAFIRETLASRER